MRTNTEIDSIKAIAEPVVIAEGAQLVDVELKGGAGSKVITLFVDKTGGVGVEDCVRVSRQVGLVFEATSAIAGRYVLEVSSPGLTRALKKPADYKRAVGKLALLKLRKPIDKSHKIFAVIDSADDSVVSLTLKDSKRVVEIDYADIIKANLEIEFRS